MHMGWEEPHYIIFTGALVKLGGQTNVTTWTKDTLKVNGVLRDWKPQTQPTHCEMTAAATDLTGGINKLQMKETALVKEWWRQVESISFAELSFLSVMNNVVLLA